MHKCRAGRSAVLPPTALVPMPSEEKYSPYQPWTILTDVFVSVPSSINLLACFTCRTAVSTSSPDLHGPNVNGGATILTYESQTIWCNAYKNFYQYQMYISTPMNINKINDVINKQWATITQTTEKLNKRGLVPVYSASFHPQVQSFSPFAYANTSIPKVASSHISVMFSLNRILIIHHEVIQSSSTAQI